MLVFSPLLQSPAPRARRSPPLSRIPVSPLLCTASALALANRFGNLLRGTQRVWIRHGGTPHAEGLHHGVAGPRLLLDQLLLVQLQSTGGIRRAGNILTVDTHYRILGPIRPRDDVRNRLAVKL